ncbi:NADH-quinone oxidoreductase subunit NuoE [Selenihalanaerobacter shriftii]|uniref:NAD(P)-dependent iron-only hydrogenase diaphorase component iron-sulfur protein n=1 Tax=Selenihalanaerobacter shriftii TaxID=142842 RepID=A0A1T4KR86_9FIRM|nr:NADH-quinone oxidoreductase subunit NuoE [Selenihalanaerobacter shriftii]SJZ44847.1 NAD(P)-dependent iron-only hydrogenase diaphorase component iron-sulfur protein [Selenihalanaerobacter shriftii]
MTEAKKSCPGCDGNNDDKRYQELDKVINKYKGEPGALIPVLHEAQKIFKYLPEEVQTYIARGLEISPNEVYGVVTFYSHFSTTPQGEYKIGVCMGTACYVKGAGKLIEEIEKELDVNVGETTPDRKFTLVQTRCIGACGLAPVITINDDVYGRLTPDQIPEILDKYRK